MTSVSSYNVRYRLLKDESVVVVVVVVVTLSSSMFREICVRILRGPVGPFGVNCICPICLLTDSVFVGNVPFGVVVGSTVFAAILVCFNNPMGKRL